MKKIYSILAVLLVGIAANARASSCTGYKVSNECFPAENVLDGDLGAAVIVHGSPLLTTLKVSGQSVFGTLPNVSTITSAGVISAPSIISTLTGAASLNILTTARGAANGVASLDASSKIPVAQLPSSAMVYQGAWNATTNNPHLTDGDATYENGDFFRASVAGSTDTGHGVIAYLIGDWIIYNGAIWEKSPGSGVISVNSKVGSVSLNTSDIPESGNLYYTDARATAAVEGLTLGGNLSGSLPNPSVASLGAISGASLTSLTAANIAAGNLGGSVVCSSIATGSYPNINAGTVSNGLYSSGSYSNPTWLVAISSPIVGGLDVELGAKLDLHAKADTAGVADSALAVSSVNVTGLANASVNYATTAAGLKSGDLAALALDTPTAIGELRYCTDCTVDAIGVSTQTVTASWAECGDKTTHIH